MKLEDLKAGDTVIVTRGTGHEEVRTVDRVTASQIIVGNGRYNRRHGGLCGATDSFSRSSVRHATAEDLERIERRQLISQLVGLRSPDLEHMTMERLREATKLIFGGMTDGA